LGGRPIVVWKELVVHSFKDLRRSVDYLETRPDIDSKKIAYYGLSTGAGIAPIMTALEPRFKARILLGGGLYQRRFPPEVDPFNFLPHVRVPTLMINGLNDYPFPKDRSQIPMYEGLAVPLPDKYHKVFDSGHVPFERYQWIKVMLDWLDKYLGPVN
jgi:dienelactone hydrolase